MPIDYSKWDKLKVSSSEDEDDSQQDKSETAAEASISYLDKTKLLEAYSDKSAWCKSLSFKDRHEWFVDCYRMRIDDDYVWGGGNLHGLYDPDIQDCGSRIKKMHVLKDFLVYTKLAVKNKVLPLDNDVFSLTEYLKSAAGLVGYAFEKSDAKEKWGGENVFSDRPSLRRTGEFVYGTSCMNSYDETEEQKKARRVSDCIIDEVENGINMTAIKKSDPKLFTEVGGLDNWAKLFKDMLML